MSLESRRRMQKLRQMAEKGNVAAVRSSEAIFINEIVLVDKEKFDKEKFDKEKLDGCAINLTRFRITVDLVILNKLLKI
jgi:uncharacterized Rmd1/YagE family protein